MSRRKGESKANKGNENQRTEREMTERAAGPRQNKADMWLRGTEWVGGVGAVRMQANYATLRWMSDV